MAAYTVTASDTVAPGIGNGGQSAVTEWTTHVGGVIRACGEAALSVLLGWTQGKVYTSDEVAQITRDAITHGASPKGGTSTPGELSATAQGYGVQLQSLDWTAALRNFAGQVPILLGIGNANALGGHDTGVTGHFITVVGKTSKGNYIVSDPNTPESVSGKFVQYTPQQLSNAQPFSAQIVRGGQTAMGSNISNPLDGVAAAINNLTSSFKGAASFATDWLGNPWRIVKLTMGVILIGITTWAVLNVKSVQVATNVVEGVSGVGNPVNRFARAGGVGRAVGARPPQVFKPAPTSSTPAATAASNAAPGGPGVQIPIRKGPGGPPPAKPQPIPRMPKGKKTP